MEQGVLKIRNEIEYKKLNLMTRNETLYFLYRLRQSRKTHMNQGMQQNIPVL